MEDSLLIRKKCPEGIDVVIDKIQSDLFTQLIKYGWRDYRSYHRAYKNKNQKSVVPEVYDQRGEYIEVLFDDTFAVTSFFLAADKRNYDDTKFVFTQDVSMIFQANVKKLFPSILHRADEEMIDSIRRSINAKGWEAKFDAVTTGFEKVYADLKLDSEKAPLDDMGDFAIAKFDFKMIYTNTEKINALK